MLQYIIRVDFHLSKFLYFFILCFCVFYDLLLFIKYIDKVGLLGEKLQIHKNEGISNVEWSNYGSSTHQRLTWYKVLNCYLIHNEYLMFNHSYYRNNQQTKTTSVFCLYENIWH